MSVGAASSPAGSAANPVAGAPEAAGAREVLPDLLRAVALLGIVVVNAPLLGISALGFTSGSVTGSGNWTVAFLVVMLAQGKFYLLFSFLFGYSSLFIVGDGSAGSRSRYRRRLLALLLIGVLHVLLLFIGDILISYALLGWALLALMGRSDRTVRATALTVTLASAVVMVLLAGAVLAFPPTGADPTVAGYDTAMATGGLLAQVQARVAVLPLVLFSLIGLQWGYAFAGFCLGVLAGRHRLLARPEHYRRWFRRAALWGLAGGLPLQFATTSLALGAPWAGRPDEGVSVAAEILGMLLAPLLSVGYLGLAGLLACRLAGPQTPRRPLGNPLIVGLRRAGQASLTIYLGESVLLVTVFSGWGLGWFGQLGAAAVTLVAVVSWALLAGVMALWLGRYRRGPVEALVAAWVNRAADRRPVRGAAAPADG